MGLVLSVF